MNQEPLFDEHVTQWGSHSFLMNGAPDTSKEAARRVNPLSGRQRKAVYDAIAAAGPRGLTDKEISAVLDLDGSSVRPRRIECEERSLIELTGEVRDGSRAWRSRRSSHEAESA